MDAERLEKWYDEWRVGGGREKTACLTRRDRELVLLTDFAAALPDEREARDANDAIRDLECELRTAMEKATFVTGRKSLESSTIDSVIIAIMPRLRHVAQREASIRDAALEEAEEIAWTTDHVTHKGVEYEHGCAGCTCAMIARNIRALKQVRPEVETLSPSSRRIGGEKGKR